MRFLHLADLHFGKAIHGVSLLDNGDQPCWVERFLSLTEKLKPDAVLIAGDVYDRSTPSGDAVELLSRMLTGLAARSIPVLLIAGNHDSADRIAFGGRLMDGSGIHMAPVYDGHIRPFTCTDGVGPVRIWMLPFPFFRLFSMFAVYRFSCRFSVMSSATAAMTESPVSTAHTGVREFVSTHRSTPPISA